ncbi:LPS biosynthesis protein [Lactococcus fujiensis JCM 16395]|uniref:LPS biosynthesis protein n=2 Tax=Lactococcus fujiensis TaxID=610251 RepID=A0A2A5RLG7_9LACT|nr:LPS biosynthesis protein [Lactococcus fujiensis JCM 16395]
MTAYIDQICRENEIEYSLGGGSLLGSIRHKGYIPWDDDIDLMLIRPNYERLMSLLTEKLPEHYSIIYYKVRPTYLPFAKIYDNRTYFTSKLDNLNKGTGVFVDIFPMDALPDDNQKSDEFKKEIQESAIDLAASAPGTVYASASKWYYFIGKLILWFPRHLRFAGKNRQIAEKVDQLMQKYENSDVKSIGYAYSGYKTEHFPREIFETYEDVQFENRKFRKIKDHNSYLNTLYGDYMQLPPENKRVNHSYYHWYWKEK